MTAEPPADVVLDTCCLVNLCAVDSNLRFLKSCRLKLEATAARTDAARSKSRVARAVMWRVPAAVVGEGIYLRSETEDSGAQPIDLEACFASGVIHKHEEMDDADLEFYVCLARDLDDGEAMALAIAKSRDWYLATDDRKGRRKAVELHVPIISTPEITYGWATSAGLDRDTLKTALARIERRARFVPLKDYPHYDWWRRHM